MPTVRILGLDPGSQHTGYGLIEKDGPRLKALAHGRISVPARQALPERIGRLATELDVVLNDLDPGVVALETPFQGINARSLIVLAQARGALLAVVARHSLEVREYSPAQVKSAVAGYGRADKNQVAKMVGMILALRGVEMSADASDALAVAVCCAQLSTLENLSAREA